jgi:hypothetical protein
VYRLRPSPPPPAHPASFRPHRASEHAACTAGAHSVSVSETACNLKARVMLAPAPQGTRAGWGATMGSESDSDPEQRQTCHWPNMRGAQNVEVISKLQWAGRVALL